MKPVRIYADTSVFGGCFNPGFELPSETLVEQVRRGQLDLVTSALVQEELRDAPARVRTLFESLLADMEIVEVTVATVELQQAYLAAQIVSQQWKTDALHVALATTSRCDAIVSWNFKHIVHLNKIALYNRVNVERGHLPIAIVSPPEVITYDEE